MCGAYGSCSCNAVRHTITAAKMQLADKRPHVCYKSAAPRCTTDTVLYTLHQSCYAAAHVTTPYLILSGPGIWVWCENNSEEDLPAGTPPANLAERLPLAAWLPAHVQGQPVLLWHHALPAASMPCPAAHEHGAPAAAVCKPPVMRPIGLNQTAGKLLHCELMYCMNGGHAACDQLCSKAS